MTKKRPTGVVVIAILHFVFGGLCGVCSGVQLIGSAVQAANPNWGAGDPDDLGHRLEMEIEARVPGFRAVQTIQAGVNLLFCLALIVSGIGLLAMQVWARVLSIAYAVLDILLSMAAAAYLVAFIYPVMNPVFDQIARNKEEAFGMRIGFFGVTGLSSCLGLAYPIAVLIVMLRPSVSAAFRAAPGGDEFRYDEDEGFDDWGERWGR